VFIHKPMFIHKPEKPPLRTYPLRATYACIVRRAVIARLQAAAKRAPVAILSVVSPLSHKSFSSADLLQLP
jgi:hypothetical protein